MNVSTVSNGSFTYSGTSPQAAAALMSELASGLEAGDITPAEAVGRLRQAGGALLEVADWIEAHPKVLAMLAAFLIAVVPIAREATGDALAGALRQIMDHYEAVNG